MGDALLGCAPSQTDEPLPIESRIEHRVPPKSKLDARILPHCVEDFRTRDLRYPGIVERCHGVIHFPGQQRAQIADVAGDQKSHYLAPSPAQQFISASKPFSD